MPATSVVLVAGKVLVCKFFFKTRAALLGV
jgi:hypothetical protein